MLHLPQQINYSNGSDYLEEAEFRRESSKGTSKESMQMQMEIHQKLYWAMHILKFNSIASVRTETVRPSFL